MEAFEPLFSASAAACSAAVQAAEQAAAGAAGFEGSPAGQQEVLIKQLLRLLSALLIAHAKVRADGQVLGSCDKLSCTGCAAARAMASGCCLQSSWTSTSAAQRGRRPAWAHALVCMRISKVSCVHMTPLGRPRHEREISHIAMQQ